MFKGLLTLSVLTILLSSCQATRNNIGDTTTEKINKTEPNQGYLRLTNESPTIDKSPISEAYQLYITDFKERWNAISDEETGDVYIHQLTPTSEPLHFHSTLKKDLELEILTVDKNKITKISILGTGKSSNDFLKMLTSWWQVLLITNPGTELHEIDIIFSKMGVGPNSRIEDLQDITFSYGGLLYKVTSQEDKIIFEAQYPTSQGGD